MKSSKSLPSIWIWPLMTKLRISRSNNAAGNIRDGILPFANIPWSCWSALKSNTDILSDNQWCVFFGWILHFETTSFSSSSLQLLTTCSSQDQDCSFVLCSYRVSLTIWSEILTLNLWFLKLRKYDLESQKYLQNHLFVSHSNWEFFRANFEWFSLW